ncbi:hypothetical protein HO133_002103 [Letharia lupina]|uniref:Uncharacterized protein n=1 Tax=Letharia lupina TaxID=560253 RepID=A0A8H6CCX6_9LECA|nr:uncharacterized protein HO133_002103 [Letharia lupina]KAF6221248.1 hypothetical protein HO133_002103 [Letharia lupina]
MPDQHNEAGQSKQGMIDPKASGRWEKKSLLGKRVNAQTLASNNYSEAMQRWVQESNDNAPWNAIGYFQKTTLAKKADTGKGKTSTNGATAGSETSASRR